MYDAILTFADGSGRLVISDKSMSTLATKVAKEVNEKEIKHHIGFKHIAMGQDLFVIREES